MAVNVIDTIKPKGEFPVVEAVDVDVNGEKLTEVLEGLATAEDLENVAQLVIENISGGDNKGKVFLDHRIVFRQSTENVKRQDK